MVFNGGREAVSIKHRLEVVFFALLTTLFAFAMFIDTAWAQTPPDANLSINKTGPAEVEPGANFTYTITVSNAAGAGTANPVTVTDELPAGVTFNSASGATCTPSLDPDGSTDVTCTLTASLAAGEPETITLNVTAPATVGQISNTATVTSPQDPTPSTSAPVVTTVAPNLVIEKLDDPDPVSNPEDLLLYTLRVRNEGVQVVGVGDIGITDEIPLTQVDFVSLSSNDFDCEYDAGLIQCFNEVSFAPGDVGTVEIVVEPEVEGTIQNTATVFACAVVAGECLETDSDTESTTVEAASDEITDNEDEEDEETEEEIAETEEEIAETEEEDGGVTATADADEQTPVENPQGNVVDEVTSDGPLPNTGGASVSTGTVLVMVLFGFALLAVRLVASWRERRT